MSVGEKWALLGIGLVLVTGGIALWRWRGNYATLWLNVWGATPLSQREARWEQHKRWVAQGAIGLMVVGALALASFALTR